jgi:hypothetical protein
VGAVSTGANAVRRVDPRLIELGLRLSISILLSLGISFLASKWLINLIDPTHKTKQQAKKSKEELMRRLGRPNIETNEHEDIIAQVGGPF